MATKTGRPVLVTTEKRGVFFGYEKSFDRDNKSIVLTQCRCCIYWPPENKGFIGLASDGPAGGARVSPAAPESELFGVTHVSECSTDAVMRWENGPWAK